MKIFYVAVILLWVAGIVALVMGDFTIALALWAFPAGAGCGTGIAILITEKDNG